MPSAFCGTFGLKATHAFVPLYPPGGSGLLSHVGPITRTVRDCAHLMATIAVPDAREIYPTQHDARSWLGSIEDGVAGLRIAYSPAYGGAVVDPQIAAAVERTVALLADLGAQVELADPGHPDCRDAFLVLWDAAMGRIVDGLTDEQRAALDPGLLATWERGRALSAYDVMAADAVRAQATLAFNRLLGSYDLLVSPTVPLLAFPLGSDVADPATQEHWVDWTPFTYPVNMTRHPAAAVPIGLSQEGLPMSMQIVGRHFDDRLVLQAARAIEKAQPFPVLPRTVVRDATARSRACIGADRIAADPGCARRRRAARDRPREAPAPSTRRRDAAAQRLGNRADDDLDALELLEVGVAGRRHRAAQAADEVHRAVGHVRRAVQDLGERADRPSSHAVAARQLGVRGLDAPVEALARRLGGARERRADHDRVGAAGDRLRQVAASARRRRRR